MTAPGLNRKASVHGPVCIEFDRGQCRAPATHEVFIPNTDGLWGAKCRRCIRFYSPRVCVVRPLSLERADMHELQQWRAGTLRKEHAS